jgi:hypothetical protein
MTVAPDRTRTVTIELDPPTSRAAHRLPELVQALTGCDAEQAELAIDDPVSTVATEGEALEVVARALLRIQQAGH